MSIRFAVRTRGLGGFSLVEVLVALVVLSVGLLGIAKMQALALSSTSVASKRALAAVEAQSLADSMHVNRGFWANTNASGLNVSIVGATVTVTTAGAAAAPILPAIDCNAKDAGNSAPCNGPTIAGYDLQQWANALQSLLPGDQATIACNTLDPIDCLVTIQWSEQGVAINSAQAQAASTAASETAGTSAAFQNPTYVLYVEP